MIFPVSRNYMLPRVRFALHCMSHNHGWNINPLENIPASKKYSRIVTKINFNQPIINQKIDNNKNKIEKIEKITIFDKFCNLCILYHLADDSMILIR